MNDALIYPVKKSFNSINFIHQTANIVVDMYYVEHPHQV